VFWNVESRVKIDEPRLKQVRVASPKGPEKPKIIVKTKRDGKDNVGGIHRQPKTHMSSPKRKALNFSLTKLKKFTNNLSKL
jgi:hypothetical protein